MAGNAWDEIEAATKLFELRQEQRDFMSISFNTISAFGPNGAIIHYRPRHQTKLHITNDSLYLVDSGGQYKGEDSRMEGRDVKVIYSVQERNRRYMLLNI